MKFAVQTTSKCFGSARLGVMSAFEKFPDFQLETPHVLLYTKGGTVPHLTYEVLQMVTKNKQILQLPLSSMSTIEDRLQVYKDGVAEFIGMKEYLTYAAIHDSIQEPSNRSVHEKDKIAVWTRSGRAQYTIERYMKFVEAQNPDMFLCLYDGDTNKDSSNKRISKSVKTSQQLLERSVEVVNSSDVLKKSAMIGVAVGGYDLQTRERYSEVLGKNSMSGILIDGLYNNETVDIDQMTSDDIKSVVQASLKHIPSDKFRIIHGSWNPLAVLDLINLGVDLFDTSFILEVTERGSALIFPNTIQRVDNISEPNLKKTKLEYEENVSFERRKYEMILKDPVHADSFTPILEDCPCLTCQKHTRAYIHHLLNVKELLGSVLLMMHNLHHYLKFFSTIRETIKSDTVGDLRQTLVQSGNNIYKNSGDTV